VKRSNVAKRLSKYLNNKKKAWRQRLNSEWLPP
jgi:hypothetical protein